MSRLCGGRALVAGVVVLSAAFPVVDGGEGGAEFVPVVWVASVGPLGPAAPLSLVPVSVVWGERLVPAAASRAVRPARSAVRVARRPVAVSRPAARVASSRPAVRRAAVRPVGKTVGRKSAAVVQPARSVSGGGLDAVVRYALAQVGKPYRMGADGPGAFDCSGLTMMAYARVGIRLPHSSGGQAGRARRVSRAAARPGDLVVGSRHVGIYLGGGWMVDAGNSRVGVVKRRMYAGLWVETLR